MEKNNWWKTQTPFTKSLDSLTRAYNQKYGTKHNGLDLRMHDSSFSIYFTSHLLKFKNAKSILLVGANDGFEIDYIHAFIPGAKITAVDVSTTALKKLALKFPEVEILCCDMDSMPINKKYDLYISLRSINSTNVNTFNALSEAVRLCSHFIISVSNGYLINNKVRKGIYDYASKKFILETPYNFISTIKMFLEKNTKTFISECTSEIFISDNP